MFAQAAALASLRFLKVVSVLRRSRRDGTVSQLLPVECCSHGLATVTGKSVATLHGESFGSFVHRVLCVVRSCRTRSLNSFVQSYREPFAVVRRQQYEQKQEQKITVF